MKFRNLKGQTFGRWEVLKLLGMNHTGGAVWKCRCSCGTKRSVRSGDLCSGHSLSCGCLQIEVMTKAEANTNHVLRYYKRNAASRNVKFLLSKKDFTRLINRVCWYCGAPPSNTCVATSGAVLKYNGVDRRNNKKAYTKENCVTCCRVCNRMKMDMPLRAFLCKVKAIAQKRGKAWKV